MQDVCRLWEVETRERNIALELEADLDVKGTWIKSDPQRIAQITINFLLNALRCASLLSALPSLLLKSIGERSHGKICGAAYNRFRSVL